LWVEFSIGGQEALRFEDMGVWIYGGVVQYCPGMIERQCTIIEDNVMLIASPCVGKDHGTSFQMIAVVGIVRGQHMRECCGSSS
jgi:hypothetical protein